MRLSLVECKQLIIEMVLSLSYQIFHSVLFAIDLIIATSNTLMKIPTECFAEFVMSIISSKPSFENERQTQAIGIRFYLI